MVFVVLLVIGGGIYFYYSKSNRTASPTSLAVSQDVPMQTAVSGDISFDKTCGSAGDFMLPGCASLVAIYNNDASICEKIPMTPSKDTGSHNNEFKQSCLDVIKTGTVLDKKFEMGGAINLGQTFGAEVEKTCAATVSKAHKIFISTDSDGGKPWGKHSTGLYRQFDDHSSVLIETCSGF